MNSKSEQEINNLESRDKKSNKETKSKKKYAHKKLKSMKNTNLWVKMYNRENSK